LNLLFFLPAAAYVSFAISFPAVVVHLLVTLPFLVRTYSSSCLLRPVQLPFVLLPLVFLQLPVVLLAV
jgi:hypothetical protein